jgi:hypothetical protein
MVPGMKVGGSITVNDKMQSGYVYQLVESAGENFDPRFRPHFSPKQMLEMGVFEGKYCNDCTEEFPADWYEQARISEKADPALNYFAIKSRQPLHIWRQNGWIHEPDPRGWFQWYCRYYLGRRILGLDDIQIKRWRGFARHQGQIRANCEPGNIFCRRRQRQALLQWSYDPFI